MAPLYFRRIGLIWTQSTSQWRRPRVLLSVAGASLCARTCPSDPTTCATSSPPGERSGKVRAITVERAIVLGMRLTAGQMRRQRARAS
jgi:hypothetical protein